MQTYCPNFNLSTSQNEIISYYFNYVVASSANTFYSSLFIISWLEPKSVIVIGFLYSLLSKSIYECTVDLNIGNWTLQKLVRLVVTHDLEK